MLETHWKKFVQPFDERRDLVIFDEPQKLLDFCVSQLIDIANTAIQDHGYFSIALAGGSTPNAIYRVLTSPDNRNKIDWSKVLLFWSDERAVSPDHADSNFRMAMTAGFDSVPLKPENIFRMQAEKHIEENAIAYEKLIEKHLTHRGFDAVLLGMGEDGHTASLFPATHGLKTQNRLVVENFVPQKDTWRMSLTYDCINASKNILIYVLGKGKETMVAKALNGPYEPDIIPIQKVGTAEHRALWILDREAASLLLHD